MRKLGTKFGGRTAGRGMPRSNKEHDDLHKPIDLPKGRKGKSL